MEEGSGESGNRIIGRELELARLHDFLGADRALVLCGDGLDSDRDGTVDDGCTAPGGI